MKNEAWIDWGKRFRAHLADNKISQASIAKKLDITPGAVRHWTNGTRHPKINEFIKICEMTGADPVTILFGAPLMSPEIYAHLKALGEFGNVKRNPSTAVERRQKVKTKSSL